MISSVNKLKIIWRFSPFPLNSFFFLSLFIAICFVSQIYVKESFLLNLLDTKVNPNCLLFSERERERERESEREGLPKSCREGVVR